jgi:hypothetical protein
MLIDVVDRHLPSGVAMTEITLRGIFPPVDIGVTVLTLIARFGEYQVCVTILTANALVHSTQSKAGLPVVELENVPKRFPTLRGMAILAGSLQRPVRALLRPRLRLTIEARGDADLEKQERVQQQHD